MAKRNLSSLVVETTETMGLTGREELKRLLHAIGGIECWLSYKQAVEAAQRAEYVAEDMALRLHSVLKSGETLEVVNEKIGNHYMYTLAKHPNAKVIILSSDDPMMVPQCKQATQSGRDTRGMPFNEKQLTMLKENTFITKINKEVIDSKITPAWKQACQEETDRRIEAFNKKKVSKTDPTGRIFQRRGGRETSPKQQTCKITLPATYKSAYKWYIERLLATRPLKPDAMYYFLRTLIVHHVEQNSSEEKLLSDKTQLIIDGMPWTPQLTRALHKQPARSYSNIHIPDKCPESAIDGGKTSARLSLDVLYNEYNPEDNNGAHTSMLKLSKDGGIHFMSNECRTALGEADTKLAAWVRRVAKTYASPPLLREKDNGDYLNGLPIIWVTSYDTDTIAIMLLLLEELYQGDPNNISFTLLVDMTHSFSAIRHLQVDMDELNAILKDSSLHYPYGCKEVINFTLLWKRLRAFLSETLPLTVHDPIRAFLMAVCMGGTDYVPKIAKINSSDILKVFFMGGFRYIDAGIKIIQKEKKEAIHILLHHECMKQFIRMVLSLDIQRNNGLHLLRSSSSTVYSAIKSVEGNYEFALKQICDDMQHYTATLKKMEKQITSSDGSATEIKMIATYELVLKKIEHRIPSMRSTFKKAIQALYQGYTEAVQSTSKKRDRDQALLDYDTVETIYKKKKREQRMSRSSKSSTLYGSNGLPDKSMSRSSSPSPLANASISSLEEWERRSINEDTVNVFSRVAMLNFWYWIAGTYPDWKCVAGVKDKYGNSVSGFTVVNDFNGKKIVRFAQRISTF